MIPIVTPEEMGAVDRAAPESVEVLVGRAGAAVERRAVAMLGGTYGRRVVVVVGKGNNGNDGRDAARRLRRRGVRVDVVDVADAPPTLPAADLVIDEANTYMHRVVGGFDDRGDSRWLTNAARRSALDQPAPQPANSNFGR